MSAARFRYARRLTFRNVNSEPIGRFCFIATWNVQKTLVICARKHDYAFRLSFLHRGLPSVPHQQRLESLNCGSEHLQTYADVKSKVGPGRPGGISGFYNSLESITNCSQ